MCRGYGIAKVIFFVSLGWRMEKMKKREEVLYHHVGGSTIPLERYYGKY